MEMKLKEIRQSLRKKNIPFYNSPDGKLICIKSCYFSHKNFFDYGKGYKKPRCDSKDEFLQELFNDRRIHIITCDECCGCAGW